MSMLTQRALPGALGASVVVSLLSSLLFLGGCGPQPTYQIVESPPPARVGTVESVREVVEQKQPSGAGLIVGGLIGGGLGAAGGAYAGHQVEKGQTQVIYQIGVKYDDGSWATINQAAPTGLHVGDRVRVTDRGLELLR